MAAYTPSHEYYQPAGTEHGTDFLSDATAKSKTLGFLLTPRPTSAGLVAPWPVQGARSVTV